MDSIAILKNNIYTNSVYNSKPTKVEAQNTTASAPSFNAQNPIKQTSFRGAQPAIALRTQLSTKDEQAKYTQLVSVLDKNERKNLELLLKNGTLLNSNSNDKTTTLDNLHKIMTNPRAIGLDAKVVLSETINTIADPYVITQNFGNVPKAFVKDAISVAKANSETEGVNEQSINVERSGACVSASIEFNLAKQMPAEFARFAQELSSTKLSVDKTIQLKNLANNTLDSVWLLNAFETPYTMEDFKSAKLTLAPDKNALIRAQIQNADKDKLERSVVDVLMQSTFMNVGSQQSYNSLTDARKGKFNQNDKGLIEFEKTFTESIVEDKNKISVTYQIVDENAKLTGYETDFKTMKKHITDSLAMGENVIIGYTQTDDKNVIINGHEITIIGTREGKDGKTIFICNDTDDDKPKAIEYSEDYLLPKIHHAGLPQAVVEKDVQYVDNWVDGIKAYNETKNKPAA